MSYIDTRDLLKRESEIEDEIELAEEQQLDADELKELRDELAEIEEIRNYCEDFQYGATLIPENEFEDYAQEFAKDIGAIDGDEGWPFGSIDWKQAASELAMDYTLVDYQGTSYYVR